jgi:hypothetical protein
MTPELLFSLSPLGYGNKEAFERRSREGFAEAAYGSGKWIVLEGTEYRIVRLWAFFKPDGMVATYEHPKADFGQGSVHGEPFKHEYSKEEFEAYKQKWKIELGTKRHLAQIISLWPTPEEIQKKLG